MSPLFHPLCLPLCPFDLKYISDVSLLVARPQQDTKRERRTRILEERTSPIWLRNEIREKETWLNLRQVNEREREREPQNCSRLFGKCSFMKTGLLDGQRERETVLHNAGGALLAAACTRARSLAMRPRNLVGSARTLDRENDFLAARSRELQPPFKKDEAHLSFVGSIRATVLRPRKRGRWAKKQETLPHDRTQTTTTQRGEEEKKKITRYKNDTLSL